MWCSWMEHPRIGHSFLQVRKILACVGVEVGVGVGGGHKMGPWNYEWTHKIELKWADKNL